MSNYVWVDKCLPPDYMELVRDAIPIGHKWYELRCTHRLMSFPITEYYQAVRTGKGLNEMFESAEFYYVWRSPDGIEEVKIY